MILRIILITIITFTNCVLGSPNLRLRRETDTQFPVNIDDIQLPFTEFKPPSLGLPIPTQDISSRALTLPSLSSSEVAAIAGNGETVPGSSGFFGNSYAKLVEELIGNLMKAASQAREAIETFNTGLRQEALNCRNRFFQNINLLQLRIQGAIDNVSDRLTASGGAIEQCIGARRTEASSVLNKTILRTTDCINERINDAETLVTGLVNITITAQEFAAGALEEMKKCRGTGNLIAAGSCLGGLALKTEVKGAVFLTQSGLQVARLNLYMATLPTSLELCAGTGLVGAGVGTARIIMEIGTCSASSVFTTLTGQTNSV